MTSDKHLYDSDYFLDRSYGHDPKRDAMYAQERARILKRVSPGRVLDVGCGLGDFLVGFDDRWEKWGIEPSDYAREKARKKGITMAPDIGGLDFEQFDLVIFRGTLQHIDFPMRALTQAVRVLKHGGLLAILATPDADSAVYQLLGTLPALEAPRNWIVFGHRCLKNIMVRLGLQDIEVFHPYWSTPYARPVIDLLKFTYSIFFGFRKFAFPGSMFEMYGVKK